MWPVKPTDDERQDVISSFDPTPVKTASYKHFVTMHCETISTLLRLHAQPKNSDCAKSVFLAECQTDLLAILAKMHGLWTRQQQIATS